MRWSYVFILILVFGHRHKHRLVGLLLYGMVIFPYSGFRVWSSAHLFHLVGGMLHQMAIYPFICDGVGYGGSRKVVCIVIAIRIEGTLISALKYILTCSRLHPICRADYDVDIT